MDKTKVWTSQHGDLPARHRRLLPGEVIGWSLKLRTRAVEAIGCVGAAIVERGFAPATNATLARHVTLRCGALSRHGEE